MRSGVFVACELVSPGAVRIDTENVVFLVYFLPDQVVRIRAIFAPAGTTLPPESSYTLMRTCWEDRLDHLFPDREVTEAVALHVVDEGDRLMVCEAEGLGGSTLVMHKDVDCVWFQLLDSRGGVLYSDLPHRGFECDHLGRRQHFINKGATTHVYGLGETSGPLNKIHSHIRLSPKDAIGYNAETGGPLYKNIPFLIKLEPVSGAPGETQALGMFYHNTHDSEFVFNEVNGYFNPQMIYSTEGGEVDLFLIVGPQISTVVSRYTTLTGRPALMPAHALGYLGSTMYYTELPEKCDEAVLGFVSMCEKHEIPVDGFQLSSGYTAQEGRRCVFTWNQQRFPDPTAFFARMNGCDVHVAPNIKPGFLDSHPLYTQLAQAGMFVMNVQGDGPYVDRWWGGRGSFFDFTNPKARSQWKDLIQSQLVAHGVSCIWNDNNEYDLSDRRARLHGDGTEMTVAQGRAILPNLMALTATQALKSSHPTERPLIVTRSGAAGIQRYAQSWSGDNPTSWHTLRHNIATVLGMGLSGCPHYGCDIGGFAGPRPSPELFVRWVQNGIFHPRFSIHSSNSDNSVTEPWMYRSSLPHIRSAIQLRYSLMPYLYSLNYAAHRDGTPIMRPLCYEFQNDPACLDESVNFLFGPFVLVANIVECDARLRDVYFPRGEKWTNFLTRGDVFDGATTVHLPVSIGSIPMFLRGASIVPVKLTKPSPSDRAKDCCNAQLKLLVGVNGSSEFQIYRDDGVGLCLCPDCRASAPVDVNRTAHILECHSECQQNPSRVVITLRPKPSHQNPALTSAEMLDFIREIELHGRDVGAHWVSYDSRPMSHILHESVFVSSQEEGWCFDPNTSCVQVRLPRCNEHTNVLVVTVSYENFDLIGM